MVKIKRLFILFSFLGVNILNSLSYAANGDVSIRVDPATPIIGEVFNFVFTIETEYDGEPYITFEPGKVAVQGKQNLGVLINTTLINGKFSTKRTIKVGYEMIVEKAGNYTIRDIKVDLDGTVVPVRNVQFKVLKTIPKPKNIFVEAVASNNDVYLGEGIDVHYYLYFLAHVRATEIKSFPKLKKFLKRFHMVKEQVESVSYNGVVYKRILKYSARVFPEQIGKLIIDPLRLAVQYSSGRRENSPFSNFGLSLRSFKTRNFQSKAIKINVKPLPSSNVPPDFSGLIGQHSFSLISNRERFLVNEPIEYKLEVRGSGALENLEAPEIFSHPDLESFDVKSEMLELNRKSSRKVFEYTFLARDSFEITSNNKTISYFDPITKQYHSVKLLIPNMIIGGRAVVNQRSQGFVKKEKDDDGDQSLVSKSTIKLETLGLVAPLFKNESFLKSKNLIKFINILLLLFVCYGVYSQFFKTRGDTTELYLAKKAIDNMKVNGMSYSLLFELVDKLNHKRTENLHMVLGKSELSNQAKEYFSNLLQTTEKVSFTDGSQNKSVKLKFDDKHFKEIYKLIEREQA
jgi:hypothetical protein